MKKVMMMVATLALVASVNAASVFWDTGNMSALPSYSAMWVGQSVNFFFAPDAGYDLTTIIANLQAGGAMPTGADRISNLAGMPQNKASGTGTASSFSAGDTVYGYAIVFNKGTIGEDLQFAISKIGTATFAAAGNATMLLGGTANFTQYDVVPEPTSMALLALGVAALGLRRKFRA